ncbi:tRNA(Met) cytidine acetyltransferase [Saliniradius amylolyticus]|uniref:tRNA(Met) cytidine acetyltransferase TmcA n=1 Tax=Saliniradius amylolyticus TaxID=2183582 RepID=A0A2S2E4C2_9ALTE|nr:GNAT family N-acetyltransferase [Saliniradius amylolyticus]AWL12483.1 tRNA(Met) cytidine acetyltransferase [Saliniradius amylolyticus]
MQTSFNDWLAQRRKTAQRHRQLLVISGPQDWAEEQARRLTQREPALWFGEGSLESIAISQYLQFLGQECPNLVFNAYSGLRASAMMALSGTIQAGGLMVLVCPPLDDWPSYRDPELSKRLSYGYETNYRQSRFTRWLTECVRQDSHVALLTPSQFRGCPVRASAPLMSSNDKQASPTDDQRQVLAQIQKVNSNKRSWPIVITADRGRGKSSALGMAAAELMQSNSITIGVTAPHRNTVGPIFRFAAERLSGTLTELKDQRLRTQDGASLIFYPPDVLLREKPKLDWLFVDEAAALPAPTLIGLDKVYQRKAFSTTIHGYEGSGRGFEIRFKPYLQKHYPNWQHLELEQPVRWFEGDMLEAFWFRVMMSDCQSLQAAPGQPIEIRELTQAELLAEPALTAELFNLMVDAHYQTTPDDLVRLMDAPDVRVYIAHRGYQICGALLIQLEGGTELEKISDAVALGQRRVNGHLTAQNLAGYSVNRVLATQNYWRVVRVAVDQNHRRTGIATALLKQAEQDAKQAQASALSVSFGAQIDLVRFWQHQQFQLARLGYRRDTASGEHNAIMLKPLDTVSEAALVPMQKQFRQEFSALLPQTFKHLDAAVGLKLLQSCSYPAPDDWVLNQLRAFTIQLRSLETILTATKHYLPHWKKTDDPLSRLLFQWSYQYFDLQELSAQHGYTGRKQLAKAIQASLSKELEHQ